MITELTTTTTIVADDKAIAETWAAMRANFRAVVRWRALYCRKRGLMKRLPFRDGDRLHERLKEYEYDAIDAHQAAERRLLELLFLNGERLTASRLP
jgi:hypothetical protein